MRKDFFKKPANGQEWFAFGLEMAALALVIVYYVFFFLAFSKFYTGQEVNEFDRAIYLFSGAGDPNPWLRSLSLIFFVLSVSFVVRLVLELISKAFKKGGAVLKLTASIIKYAAVIVLIFLILSAFHVDTVTLLVSAGVVSLVIGLGAQSLISDVIAGLFIVFEDVYNIGDIIVIDDFRGTVKEIGVRTTQIVDWAGNIKIVNNSDIRSLVNMTSEIKTAFVTVDVEYGESVERVESVIKGNLDRMKKNIPDILEGPFYIGVSDLGASGVTLAFIAQCQEQKRFQVERDMRRELKLIFDENDVGIPFNQVTINQPKDFQKPTKKDVAEAKEFLEEQKAASQGIPIDTDKDN